MLGITRFTFLNNIFEKEKFLAKIEIKSLTPCGFHARTGGKCSPNSSNQSLHGTSILRPMKVKISFNTLFFQQSWNIIWHFSHYGRAGQAGVLS